MTFLLVKNNVINVSNISSFVALTRDCRSLQIWFAHINNPTVREYQ